MAAARGFDTLAGMFPSLHPSAETFYLPPPQLATSSSSAAFCALSPNQLAAALVGRAGRSCALWRRSPPGEGRERGVAAAAAVQLVPLERQPAHASTERAPARPPGRWRGGDAGKEGGISAVKGEEEEEEEEEEGMHRAERSSSPAGDFHKKRQAEQPRFCKALAVEAAAASSTSESCFPCGFHCKPRFFPSPFLLHCRPGLLRLARSLAAEEETEAEKPLLHCKSPKPKIIKQEDSSNAFLNLVQPAAALPECWRFEDLLPRVPL
ncbi:Hypothetical predicted protein [Podarcis lilfordi]|uniref:Uncharacterized protein n=1 Tax=Podarcis lilfordi TaxID=74358 RepID=A0AA35KA00_9SAUR|nr:Hypothetical predicted protein [Podarcis lilfordi]